MDFDGIYYSWLHLWMLASVPLVTFALGILSGKMLRKLGLSVLLAMGIVIVVITKLAGG
jgi:hypothetical protein